MYYRIFFWIYQTVPPVNRIFDFEYADDVALLSSDADAVQNKFGRLTMVCDFDLQSAMYVYEIDRDLYLYLLFQVRF